MRSSRMSADAPVVITSAAVSLDDQHDLRRRKYLTMMGIRVLCVIAAALTAGFSLLLALAFMVGGAVLPWCAVLIANDRPAQRSTAFVKYRPPTAPVLPSAVLVVPSDSWSSGPSSSGASSSGTAGRSGRDEAAATTDVTTWEVSPEHPSVPPVRAEEHRSSR